MVGRSERQGGSAIDHPAAFVSAVHSMRRARLRPEISCEEMPAPQRIAPYSAALSADVSVDGLECGTGRLIVLHDPQGNDAWEGTFRCVAYARAEIDPDMLVDPALGGAAWSWLDEALSAHSADVTAVSGTVTRVGSESFGQMADDAGSAQVEIRASWTPVIDHLSDAAVDLSAHVEAWGELLCTAAGLPPLPEGVTSIPTRRGQRGH